MALILLYWKLSKLKSGSNLLQVIEECVVRLDVAMFNGILRDPEDDAPTDPLSDPITDLSVLPIPIGSLTFGAGSHLKNVVCVLFCVTIFLRENF